MVLVTVKQIISEQLGIDPNGITTTSNIQYDLGIDSMDMVDLMMALEDEFDVEIPEDQVKYIKTIGDIVKFVEDNKASRTSWHRSLGKDHIRLPDKHKHNPRW